MEDKIISEVLEKFGAFGLILLIGALLVYILWKELKKKDKTISDKDQVIINLVGDFHKVATKSADSIDKSAETLTELNRLLHSVNTDIQVIKSNGK